MGKPPESEIVRCYEEMHRIWYRGMWTKSLLSILIFFGFSAMGVVFHADWLQLAGVLVIGATIVVPHLLRIERGYNRQTCPACGRRVGRTETRKSRIVLVCQHCGTRTPTDCAIHYSGGPPSKVS